MSKNASKNDDHEIQSEVKIQPKNRENFVGISRDDVESLIHNYNKKQPLIQKFRSMRNGESKYRKMLLKKSLKSEREFLEMFEKVERESREKVKEFERQQKSDPPPRPFKNDFDLSSLRQTAEILTVLVSYKLILQTQNSELILLWLQNLSGLEVYLISSMTSVTNDPKPS